MHEHVPQEMAIASRQLPHLDGEWVELPAESSTKVQGEQQTATPDPITEPWKFGTKWTFTLPDVFAQRYAGMSYEQLRSTYHNIEDQFSDARRLAWKQAWESGPIVQRQPKGVDRNGDGVIEPGEFGDLLKIVSGDPWVQTRSGPSPVDGSFQVDAVWLPVEEHADLYALHDELTWLRGKINKLEGELIGVPKMAVHGQPQK